MRKILASLFYVLLIVNIFSSCKKTEDISFLHTKEAANDATVATSTSTSAMETPKGLYAVQRVNKAQDDAVLKNTSIDGIFIRTTWSSIESIEGSYDWTFIDSEIDRAIANNKKVEIAIMAGDNSPSWLERKGVKFLDFKIIPHAGEGNPHWTHIPIVWDAQFITSYSNMVKAFASHLKSSSARYNAISLIKINGINQETAETRLPYQDTSYISGTDTASNAPQIWIANGYAPSKVLAAWDQLATVYSSSFPDKAIGTAIIPDPRGFPSIDETGALIKDRYNYTTKSIIDKSILSYNNQNILLFNSLTDKSVTSDLLTYVTQANTLLSFQENEVYDGKSNTWVENMIKNGVNSGGKFIEIFNATIKAYPTGVARGRTYFK